MTKNSIFKIVLFISTVISLFFVPWILVKAWILPMPDSVQEQANEAIENGFDGIVVYAHKVGEPAEYFTAGWHNKEDKIPAKPNALFKIASISKLYTAVSIAKLVNDGRLSLTKTVADYLPELSKGIENVDKITIKMLVKHRSGIPNYTATENYWASPKTNNEDKLKLILNTPANFEPDSDFEYCNTNYLLLSIIMDKTLGYRHFQFIQKEILDRLHLKNTYSSVKKVNMDSVMSGYHVGHPFDLKADDLGMVASAHDVGVFLRALNNGSVFDEKEMEIYSSIYEFEHKGWVPGYQSIAKYHKDIDLVLIQFTNTTDPKLYNWNLADIEYSRILKLITEKGE